MENPSLQPPPPPPPAPDAVYLLLIDSRVANYQDIISSKQNGVLHIVFDVGETATSSKVLFETIQDKIAELGVPSFMSIGLVQHNYERPIYEMFGPISDEFKPVIYSVKTTDPDIQTWNSISSFITTLRLKYGIQYFDMMACALYSNPDWKYVIDTLAVQTGVTVRASTDDTGAAALGGDWFLESHTGVNLKDVYFTEAIENFSGVLVYSTKYDSSSLFTPKSFAVGKVTAWGATGWGGGTNINTITGSAITSDVVALYSNGEAFAALKTNGSVSTWGSNSSGANQTVGGTSPSVASSLTSGVVEIFANRYAQAALKNDGTVVTWGTASDGGNSTSVVLTNVVDIYSASFSFAALKSNGSVVTWGASGASGGDSSSASPNLNSGVVSVNMVANCAALKSDGSVVTWPTGGTMGGNSSTVTSSISSNVVVVYSSGYTFAALNNSGRVIVWGDLTYANTTNRVDHTSVTLTNIVTIIGQNSSHAALNINGGVVTWGVSLRGGDSSGKSLSSNVVKVYNNGWAFAALKFDGSVVTWGGSTNSAYGGNSTSVASDLSSGVVAVYGNGYAFAALKSNGRVITWGDALYGANSSSVATDISAGIVGIYVTQNAFAALRNDGKLITWGESSAGGNSSSVSTDLSAGVISVNNTAFAFAAITSSATTFDLSMSYYRDIDRYNILRNKDNRRRANLTTLNNNVFTLSSVRDVQKFNYTIPSGNSFRIIIPDYVSSNYSIISTATLPSDVSANYIIACEEGEPVTISDVTYINYGAFVYRRNIADNTFTKMTSTVIGGVTYNLYGGDGIFSSGIAFQYRFGAFAVPEKTFGDASFNITAPLTDSSGAFTYTSSNTAVATVTAGGTVTIVSAGTTTITATQAAIGSFTSDSITASLVVNKVVSTLGALTVPAKIAGDAPFTLTAPTSTTLSFISPVNTITSTASMIVPPPMDILDIRDISYGTTWLQWGADIVGTQVDERSGTSVSMSADGTIVAIGSFTFNVTGSNEGRTRIYKYNGSSWVQLGLDILGIQADEESGYRVSLSADGTIVAIGSPGFNATNVDVGRTRVFQFNGTSWIQLGLDISGNQTTERSGESVSLSADGTVVAIGSTFYDKAGGATNTLTSEGRTRIYKYNGTSWSQLGLDISGNQADERSGYNISLSMDGTIVAIGSYTYNVTGSNEGRTRIYKYNGTSWGQLGLDISGNQADETSGVSVCLSADGTIVAIGSNGFNTGIADVGRTRVYKYNGTSWGQLGLDITGNQTSEEFGYSVSLSADGTIVAVGSYTYDKAGGTTNAGTNEGRTRVYKYNGSVWSQLGLDISANQVDERAGISVSISSDGTTVAVGSAFYDSAGGNTNSNTSQGRTRIYNIATTNAITYTSSSSSIADVCGNLLLIKGADGTSAITASQNGNTYTGRLDVSGTTYTLQYNAITYTSSNTDVATVSTYGTVTITGGGTSTITATQPETRNYASRSVTATLDVSRLDSTLGPLTIPAKLAGDAPFTLTTPTSTVSSIISPVNTITSTASMIVPPSMDIVDIRDIGYGTTWNQLGLDISGNQVNEQSGWSVSISADGTVLAIGSPYYDRAGGTTNSSTSEGRTRIYKYNGTSWGQLGLDISGTQASEQSGYSVSLSADGMTVAIGSSAFDTTIADVGRTRVYKYNGSSWVQLGLDILGIQAAEQSGWRVSLSADGTVVAIGSFGFDTTIADVGRTRIYKYNGTSWGQLGLDISGNQTGEQSGWSVSLSADGMTVAIGSPYYDRAGGTTNTVTSEGRTRIYKYNGTSWGQLGLDISGNQADERSGFSVSMSADGTTVAIGSYTFNVTGSNEGRTRLYKYNGTSWGQLGLDILGNQADENSGISVCLSTDGTIVAIGSNGFNTGIADVGRTRVYKYNGTSWNQLGLDISGNQTSEFNGTSVSLSADGTTVAIGSDFYDRAGGTTNAATNEGRVRIYNIATTNAITYTSSSSSIADVCGNLLLIKGVNGTSTITASQSGNTYTGRLDVSGTTYTLQYNPITYTISDASLATVSTYGTVTLTGIVGTSTITATQPQTRNYLSKSVTATLDVSRLDSTLGALTVPAKLAGDDPFTLTAPTSTVSSIISPVNTITSTASVIPTPPEIRDISYGTTWLQLGLDISGNQLDEYSGHSVSVSADGTVVAIASNIYDTTGVNTSEGRTRIYKYNGTSWGQLGLDISGNQTQELSGYSVSLSADGNTVAIGSANYDKAGGTTDTNTSEGRTRIFRFNGTSWVQLGLDISGNQAQENSGSSVSLSADGNTVAIGSYSYDIGANLNVGRTRIFRFNGTSWNPLGLDISGNQADEYSGHSVSLSADGNTVAIGSYFYDMAGGANEGRTRIFRFNGTSWNPLGLDITGNQLHEHSGWSVSLSADGNTVAIGSRYYDKSGGTTDTNTQEGRTRIYKYNGTSWTQMGLDISGNQIYEYSGWSVSLSADGNTVAIGSQYYDIATNADEGRTRIYKYNGTSWGQLGLDISGNQASERSGWSVSLSADGNTVAIGSFGYDKAGGTTNTNTNEGRVRIYNIATTNAITYTSSSSSIADVCGNLLLIKGVNGTSTITASQNGNTYNGRLDVSGTTYTLQYNPITYTNSDASLATVSTYGTVTLTGTAFGTSTITATQPQTRNYLSKSVTATLDVSGIITVLGPLTIPTKAFGDASFNITAPSTNNPSGAFTYTSSNTAVATVTSGGLVSFAGIGTTTITATQAASGLYTSASVSGSLVVNFGNTSSITRLPTDGAYVIPTPVSNIATTYGSIWNQLGADTVGKVSGDESGTSISVSADGTIVAIGARSNSTNRGTVRVYKYNDVSWNQIGSDINGEASSDYSGQSVSLSANGRVVAIGANMNDGSGNLLADSGHVRIYEFNGTTWVQRGEDIDGEAAADQSGISVSLSEDGNIVAIGAIMNDGSGNALSNSGHVRVYKYNASKTSPQLTDQSAATFGPVGWDRLGADIDGEAVNDQSGFSVSLSADGTIVAIGAIFNDGTSGTVDTSNNRGHVRVYRYNASKTSPQLTNQSLTTFGPAGWDRMGSDIDGEVAADQSGFSVSLSADGSAVAIGSPLYDVSGVSNSGRVRVFAWNGSSWAQRGQNINGVNLNENVGDSVSLSANGSILSVSSFMKVVNYNYNSSTNTWSQIGANVTGASATTSNITNASLYSPHVYLDATNPTSYNRTTNTWTNIGSVGGNVVMTNMVGNFDASDNGGSFNFNGSTNRGQLNITSTTLTSITYLAVVKTTRLNTSYATIIEFGVNTLLFNTNNNGLNLYPSNTSTFSLAAGVWYVLAVTKNTSGSITGYVNGVSVFTGSYTGTSSTTSTVYGIGSGLPTGDEYWNGKISALAVYHNRVLTASEIANVSSTFQTYRVSLSSQGNILAVGAREYHGTTGTSTNIGVARVYRIDTSGNYTFSSSNTAIADVCGNIILPKTMGSTTIAFTQSASGATASRSGTIPLIISGITPTIGALTAPAKNFGDAAFSLTAPTSDSDGAFTYESSNTAVATVTSGGTVTVVGAGSTTITATQDASGNYTGGSVTASLVVSPIAPTFGAFTVTAKNFGDASFNLTAPTSDSDGAFSYTSSAPAVATVTSDGTVTVVGAGTTTITATQAASADGNYTTRDISGSLVVSPIAPTFGAFTVTAKNFGDASFNLTAPTSDSDGAFSYTSSAPAVATVTSDGTVTVVGAGTTTITATQAASADGNYTTRDISGSLVVSPIAPTFGAFTVTAKNFGDASFNLTAPTSDSDGAFSYTSSAPAVATVTSDGTVTVVGAGSTTITATQAATTNYTTRDISNSLVVSPIAPSIGALSAPAKNFGDASFNLTAPTSDSDGAFSYTSSAPAVATVTSGGMVTVVGAGTTTITATQDATTNYTTGSVTASLVVSSIAPTYQSISQITKTYSTDVSFSLTAVMSGVSNSTGAYTFSSTSAAIDICGGVATILAYTPSAITITATQAAYDNYTASSTTFALLVNRKVPSYGEFSVPAATYEDVPFSIAPYAPTTDSTGVPFTYTSSEPTVAAINSDGTVITIIGQGYTTITASQAAGGNYAANSITTSFLVNRAAPTFLKAFTIPNKTFGDASFSLLPFTEGLDNTDGTYHFTSSNAQLVSISEVDGVTATILAYTPAPITIYVAIDACGNYAASSTSGTLTVARAIPVFGTFSVPTKNFGDASFNLTAPTSNSNGVFTYSCDASNVANVTSAGNVVIVGVGSATITATQDTSGNYTSRVIDASFVVAPIAPTIGALSVPAKNFGDASFNLVAPTSNSDGAITYSSSVPAVATVTSGGTVTIVGAGTTTITASQAATTNYTSSAVTASFVVSPIAPTIGALSVPAKNFRDASFSLTAPTTDSSGAFTYTSSAVGVATVTSSGVVTVVGAGSSTITATQDACGNFTTSSVTGVLVVSPIAPTIGALSVPAKNFGDASFSLTAPTTDSSGAFTYTSSAAGVATVTSSGVVTVVGAGSSTITATQDACGNFTTSSVTGVLVVSPIIPPMGAFTISNMNFGVSPFTLTPPTSDSSGAFSYTSLNTAVATVSGSTVTIVSAGTATIRATQEATTNYTTRVIDASFVVATIAPTFGAFTVTAKTIGDAPFNITAPLTDSSGAFTFTSSNTGVATVTTGGIVSIIGSGTTTITVTQAASGNYTSNSTTASLVVNKIVSTLGALTVPAKLINDPPFTLTAPTSSISSIISPVNTITSTGSMIPTPPEILDISYGTTWGQLGLDISANQLDERSGFSVSVSADGTIVAVGSYTYNVTGSNEGRTRVYKYNGTSWSQLGLDILGNQADELVGVSVCLSADGTTVAIGSSGFNTPTVDAGRTRVYKYNGTSWGQLGLDISGNQASEESGYSVSLSADGKTVAIGSYNYDKAGGTTNAGTNEGRTRVYKYNGSVWGQLGLDISANQVDERSGFNVSLSSDGTTVAIGSYTYDKAGGTTNAGTNEGRTRVYKYNGTSWGQLGFDISANQLDERSGYSVSLSSDGTTVAIGSYTYNVTGSNEGRTRIYKFNGNVWGQLGLDILGNQADENSGVSVCLSADGTIVAIGSSGFNTPTVDAGRTRIYKYNGSVWGQLGLDISGNQVDERSGYSVSLSSDGTTVAIGSYTYDKAGGTTNAGTNEGRTRIYKIATTNAITYTSSSSSIADVCGNLLLIKGVNGTSTITASQTGNTITGRLDVSGTTYTLQYNPITYTISDASLATVSTYGTVTLTGTISGTSTITATQPETLNYASRSVTGSLVVSRITPTIGVLTAPAKNFGDASFNLTAPTSNSNGVFNYTSDNSGVAIVTSGGMVTVVGAGTTTITAFQAGTTIYTTGSVVATLVISPIAPTFGTFTVPTKNFGDASFNLTAPTSDSSGAFSYTSLNTSVATVSGSTVTIVGGGTATIRATQASTTNYTSRVIDASFVVAPIAPTFGAFTVPTKNFGDASFNLTAPTTDSSGAFSYQSLSGSVATVSGSSVTIVGAGTATIRATQAATTNHTTRVIDASFVVAKLTPVITLASITKTYGDMSFNLAPSSTNTDISGSIFSFSSNNPSVASIFDTSYVSINGVGSAIITISQTTTPNFTDASGTVTITVNKATPVLSAFTVSSNRTYGSAPFSALVFPTSVSNGEITYSSSDDNIATIDNSGVITLVASGYVTFIATQATTSLYNQATKVSNTMTVHRQILLLTRAYPTDALINKTYGDPYFTVSATNASNGGTITYESNNSSVAGVINSISNVISVVSVGTATITARRASTAQYSSEPISWTVEVARAITTLSGLTDLSYNVTAAPFTVSASSISDGAFTYSLQDPSSTVLTIGSSSGLVTLRSPGTAVIVASQALGTLYQTPASITATITVSSAGNVLQGATITSTSSFASVNLSGASLTGVSITNTAFTDAKLRNADLTNAVITNANFTGADLSGATLSGATITGSTFTATSLKNADLSGATLTSTVFTGSDLSGAKLTGVDASGASFANAKLNNVDLTGANIKNVNFTNTSIKGAIITDISFSPLQKLQLLKNPENRNINEIIITQVSGTTALAAISESSPLRAIANLDLTSAGVVVSVAIPQTSIIQNDVLLDTILNVQDYDVIYLPINENDYFQINGVKYYSSEGVVRNYPMNEVVEIIKYDGKSVWLLAGSIIALVLQTNTLNTSSFVVPRNVIYTDTTPFMPTTLPTTNSESPIVYSSNNPYVATIDSSSGLITITGYTGMVKFTATQVQNSTYEPGIISSNYMVVSKNVNFSLNGLNQSFSLSTLAMLDASSINMDSTDATAVFYVRLSDLNNVFKYQTDAYDINDMDASDIKYYVFHRKWPTELKINPSHAMTNTPDSAGMLGLGNSFANNKSLIKHDFIRHIALRLFNTIHGVDLFRNEIDLLENSVYLGETVRYNIDGILSGISTTSSSGSMSYDASANKYLTNDSSGNSNLCRELMRQVAAGAPSRFYNNGGNDAGLKNVPFLENDAISFKVIIHSASSQNVLTGVSEIPSRSYTIKLVVKNTVTSNTNANTAVVDSEMYPNSYPYSSSVVTYAPTSDSSGVYNIYSPPAPIPFSRFGYNGWYYTNSTAWVSVASAVRDRVKWVVPANTGSSTVADLQYVRLNLKIHNNASLPYLMIHTQAGSMRKYAVIGGNGSLTNGTLYSLYMNFNSYSREPAMVGYTNAALEYTIGSGAFANNEVITSISIETESNAAAGNVEFTLANIIVGELTTTEKEYGFEAAVPVAYS